MLISVKQFEEKTPEYKYDAIVAAARQKYEAENCTYAMPVIIRVLHDTGESYVTITRGVTQIANGMPLPPFGCNDTIQFYETYLYHY